MATGALKQRGGDESKITTKAIEIQTVIHQQILDLGNEVYKKTTERQQRLFEDHLLKHESKLVSRLEGKKYKALEELRQSQQDEIDSLKVEFTDLQNVALNEEARRVEAIMAKKATELVERTQFEGQRKLDEALIEARARFDVEKRECVEEVIRKVQSENEERMRKQRLSHQHDVDKLNKEWEETLKEYEESNRQHIKNALEKQRAELDAQHEESLQKKLHEMQVLHNDEVEKCQKQMVELDTSNSGLNEEISDLDNTLQEMKDSMNQVLGAFRTFIESSPGFNQGQSDFVLDNLIPRNVEEFLRQ